MIFVDTSYWFALQRKGDPNHDLAYRLLERHSSNVLVISNHVQGETWTLINRREGHAAAIRFLDGVSRSPRLRLIHVDEQLETQALAWLRQRNEREYSFVDATSFALMARIGIGSALAFGGDFAAAGFVELRS